MQSAIMARTFKPRALGIFLVFRIIQEALHINKRISILMLILLFISKALWIILNKMHKECQVSVSLPIL